MRYYTVLLSLSAALLVVSHPHQQTKRQSSPDSTCGSPNGFICSDDEPCCSQFGFCGSTSEYCGSGCQAAFGTCDDGGGTPTNTQPPSSPSPSPSGGGSGGGGVRGIPRPKIGSVPYGSVITSCVRNGDVALTFDDGPYIYTAALLDLLARYSVKASFFVVGSNGNGDIDQVSQWADLIRRMYAESHHVASHTWTHPYLTRLSSADRREQMYRNEEALANILGVIPTYMRPPYLDFDDATGADMADLGYHVISTNLDTLDWQNFTPETIQQSLNIFSDATNASPASSSFIVLNHDIYRTTVYTEVEFEIQRLQSRGYRAVTVGECLGDSPANWYRPASGTAQAAISPGDISSTMLEGSGMAPPTSSCDRPGAVSGTTCGT